jgi:hypothetical protein
MGAVATPSALEQQTTVLGGGAYSALFFFSPVDNSAREL